MIHDSATLFLAAVRFRRGSGVDRLLAEAVKLMRAGGLVVGGALQEEEPIAEDCCAPMLLADLGGGGRTLISQALGRQSRGCRLDPQALAAVAGRLEAVLGDGLDLLVLNRFGKAEADGGGFRPVIERALDRGLPVLIAVREDFWNAWAAFHGGLAVELPAEPDAIAAWGRDRVGEKALA